MLTAIWKTWQRMEESHCRQQDNVSGIFFRVGKKNRKDKIEYLREKGKLEE